MKILSDWKKRLAKDWSSWSIYFALFLTGLESILREYGSSFISEKYYGAVMSGVLTVTLVLKILHQKDSAVPPITRDGASND
jgi:hypothetical protein